MKTKQKRVMIDMSATILHHGHIRLLKKAAKYGKVIVGLTKDKEIEEKKGYIPELRYKHRKEILKSIKYVDEVVATPWLLTEKTLKKHNIDLLVHGEDNSNKINKEKLLIFPRTDGISSSLLRKKSATILKNKIQKNILLNPGPATTTQSVKLAQIVADICPREQEFGDLMETISLQLTKFVATPKKYTTVLFSGSGTAAVESVLSSVIDRNKKVLIINNGSYGKRMCQIAQQYNINYIEFKSSPIKPINIKKLQNIITSHTNISHLCVVHNETTTGLLNDITTLGKLSKKHNLELIVDAMSSYAAIPINMNKQHINYLIASSNKNLQGMAGVSFVIAKISSLKRLQSIQAKSFYLDLHAQYKNFISSHQMRFTPPVQTLYALKQAIVELQQEGVKKRYKRYTQSWKLLTDFLKDNHLSYLVDDNYHSKIITAILIPKKINFDAMHTYFLMHNITIYPGKVEDFNSFRVANIGAIDSSDMKRFLQLFQHYLLKKGVIKC
jgi:2-aminoethylphosphonate-pyruvate transaminase